MTAITTPEELDALPVGSVVLSKHSHAWQRVPHRPRMVVGGWVCADPIYPGIYIAEDSQRGAILPATVLYRPNLPQNRPEDATGGAERVSGGSDEQGGLKSAPGASAVERAVKGIQDRLSWASLHWGTEGLLPDALPHIALAAFESIDVDELVGVLQREFGLDGPVPWSSLDADDIERMRVQAHAIKAWLTGSAA